MILSLLPCSSEDVFSLGADGAVLQPTLAPASLLLEASLTVGSKHPLSLSIYSDGAVFLALLGGNERNDGITQNQGHY